MKNRTIIGVICIALAVAIMFGVSPFISMLASEKISVIQLNKNISEGTQIKEDDVVTVEIAKEGLPNSVITDASEVVGQYATTDIYKNLSILPEMLSSEAISADTVFKKLDSEHMAISITVPSFAAALSAKLENGDIVSVIVSTPDETFTPRELTYMKVITTTTSEGVDRDDIETVEEGEETLPATVTLYASPLQAKLLAEYEAKADMHIALVSRGNKSAEEAYLSEQQAILDVVLAEQQAAKETDETNEPPAEVTPKEAEAVESEDGGEKNG